MNVRRLLGIDEVALMLGVSVQTLKCDVSRRPHMVPPRVRIPGSRRVRWRHEDVVAWIEQHIEK